MYKWCRRMTAALMALMMNITLLSGCGEVSISWPQELKLMLLEERGNSGASLTGANYELFGDDVVLHLAYQTDGGSANCSVFSPPGGDVFHLQAPLEPGEGTVKVRIPLEQFCAAEAMTISVYAPDDSENSICYWSVENYPSAVQTVQRAAKQTGEADNSEPVLVSGSSTINYTGTVPMAVEYSLEGWNDRGIAVLDTSRRIGEINGKGSLKPYSDHWIWDDAVISEDLSDSAALAYTLTVSNQTEFVGGVSVAYDRDALIEWGKAPGLDVDLLHEFGYTGKGAVIAYVDQPLIDHEQYSGADLHYTNNSDSNESMHGPAVLSLLAGRDIGTAPEAEVYYYAHAAWKADQITHAGCLYQIIEQNKQLPKDEKITMVGFSDNIDETEANAEAFRQAVDACKAAGVMVFFCGDYAAGTFLPLSDKNDPASVVPESWWGENSNSLFVPAAGRTTAGMTDAQSYTYWAEGGLSWTMPYVLGLYAIANEIDPTLGQEDLLQMLKDTAYQVNDIRVIHPVEFVAAVLDGAGRTADAQALRQAEVARRQYLYVLCNSHSYSKAELDEICAYAASQCGQVLVVDASQYDNAQALYSAIQADAVARSGQIAGVQIFGTPAEVPAFTVSYKVTMADGQLDDGGTFLTDLFYGNFSNNATLLDKSYNISDQFAQGLSVNLLPLWQVARLPLHSGELLPWMEKYQTFIANGGSQGRLVNFSNPIFNSTRHIDDMGLFLRRAVSEWDFLATSQLTLYANLDGDAPVTDAVTGNFLPENLTLENGKGPMELLINSHGQWNNIDHCIFRNGEEERISLVNMETINTVLAVQPYYLDCWTCLNGYGMDNDLITAAMRGQCMGAFAATTIISNNGVDCRASLEQMRQSNFYWFYYCYLQALSRGDSRSKAFLYAQQAYTEALLECSEHPLQGEGNYQFGLYNLLAYHNFGLLER